MPLELKDLTEDERLALVALLERVVEADGRVTDPEAKQLHAVVAKVGKKAYEEAAEEVDRHFEDEQALRRFLQKIERQEARELIYETVLEIALADVPVRPETAFLDWLARVWHIKVKVVDPPPGA